MSGIVDFRMLLLFANHSLSNKWSMIYAWPWHFVLLLLLLPASHSVLSHFLFVIRNYSAELILAMIRLLYKKGWRNRSSGDKFFFYYYYYWVATHQEAITNITVLITHNCCNFFISCYLSFSDTYIVFMLAYWFITILLREGTTSLLVVLYDQYY